MASQDNKNAYWQENLKVLGYCLIIWFVVSFGFGILLRDALDTIRIGGYGLGFWFAQQGSILVFLGLVFFYSWKMNQLDKKYHVEEVQQPIDNEPDPKLEKDDEWGKL